MKAKNFFAAVLSALVLPLTLSETTHAQGTAFTYQGQLNESGAAANGNFDFTFGLYTNVSTGNLIGAAETNLAVGVSNGVFTTTLNFSNAFNGTAYWLGIGVRTNGSTGAFTTLSPRQAITPTPYAITASNLTGALPASQLTGQIAASNFSGTFSNSVSFTNTANVFAGNGSGLTNVPGVTSSNFLYAYDYTDQELTSGAFQGITFGTNFYTGWTVPGSGEFVAGAAGVYLVHYNAHVYNNSSTGVISVSTRALFNITTSAVEIPGSEAALSLYPNFVGELSHSFIVTMTAGEMISLQIGASAANTAYLYSGTFESATGQTQSFSSVSINIVRIQ